MTPEVKLVDDRGRTVCVFRRTAAHGNAVTPEQMKGGMTVIPALADKCPYWAVVDKPMSRQRRQHIQEQLAHDGHALIPEGFGQSRYPVTFDDAGLPVRLDIPGLSLRWEKVVDILDSLAAENDMTMTVAEFRQRVSH